MELLRQLGVLAGEALSHHARRELTAGDSQAEIRALVQALAESDGDTYRHSLEVAATATALGRGLGLDRTSWSRSSSARSSRRGQAAAAARAPHQARRAHEEERQLIRRHPDWGAEMVGRIPGLEAVALIVRLHHERPDGLGYPHGLTHDRIPMATRIVSVSTPTAR